MRRKNSNGADTGFENKLWEMADKLIEHVDAPGYKPCCSRADLLKMHIRCVPGEIQAIRVGQRDIIHRSRRPRRYASRQYLPGSKGCPREQTSGKRQTAKRRQAGRYRHLHAGIRIHTTWRLAMTNPAIRGMDVDWGSRHADSFLSDLHRDIRGAMDAGEYEDVHGFCKSSMAGEIMDHGYVLASGRYVGAAETPDDGEPFDEKMKQLTTELIGRLSNRVSLGRQLRRILGFWVLEVNNGIRPIVFE